MCGSTEHYIKNCPSRGDQMQALMQNQNKRARQLPSRGRGQIKAVMFVRVQGERFLTNLMKLPFEELDLILGLDWLVEHQVNLDGAVKRVTLNIVDDKEIVMVGKRRVYLSNVISAMLAKRLIRKRYEAYLAYVSDTNPNGLAMTVSKLLKSFHMFFPRNYQNTF
ncbi:DNA/RNA polymerases superfamily protein [Gossypium australe]|uniref:DNA/RNA polymerases superfamily protein n=1 Tax=Gossypium australe TaxID=47621 RepID=A0A5B6WVD2_9ROSI|nr:DNA/RNA polymerases superfamily protein [Gossypium australe]